MPRQPTRPPVSLPNSGSDTETPPVEKPARVSYSADTGAAICLDVEEGVPLPEAFLCNGVAAETGRAWLASQPDFAHEVEIARARYLRSLIREVREGSAGSGVRHDWRASLALLERADQAAARADSEKGNGGSITVFSPAQLIDLQARRRQAAAAR